MSKQFSITVDIGTTNSKVSLFDIATGRLIARKSFPTFKKKDPVGELFDLELIWQRLLAILTAFVAENAGNVDSINISSVGEAGVLLDESGVVVSPLIAWYDKRAARYIEQLTTAEKERIYQITGLPAHPNYSLGKIKWLVDELGLAAGGKYLWLNVPDLLCYYLTGKKQTEFSMASRTMCYDLKRRCWSEELLALFGLTEVITFPPVASSGTVVGYTSDGELPELNHEEIAVRIAGHDHMVGALGINLHPQELLNSTGTTEGLLLTDEAPFINEESFGDSLSNGVFTDPQYYTLFSSMPTGGNAFAWYQELFNVEQPAFEKACLALFEGYQREEINLAEQLLIVPHLNGSGAPFKNTQSRGLISGINLQTKKEDLLFGLLLGLCLEMKMVADCFPLDRVKRIVVIGPAIKNPLWLQLKADALNRPVSVVKMAEAVSFGALKAAYRDFSYETTYQTVFPTAAGATAFEQLLPTYRQLSETKRLLLEPSVAEDDFALPDLFASELGQGKELFFN